MASSMLAYIDIGAGPTAGSAEGGIKFSLEDSVAGATPITIPQGAPSGVGTNFSWIKNLYLFCQTAGGTTISARTVNYSGALATGLTLWWKANSGAYAQASGANMPAASGANGATPTTFTQMTSSAASYDASAVAAVTATKNGAYCQVVLGVDGTYAGGAGSNQPVPSVVVSYNEA
jgi:hypothetical protein